MTRSQVTYVSKKKIRLKFATKEVGKIYHSSPPIVMIYLPETARFRFITISSSVWERTFPGNGIFIFAR